MTKKDTKKDIKLDPTKRITPLVLWYSNPSAKSNNEFFCDLDNTYDEEDVRH